MKNTLVILVDNADPKDCFWETQGWPDHWSLSIERSFTICRLPGFQAGKDPFRQIRDKLVEKVGAGWEIKFSELFVVTDSHMDGDPAGGSHLLEQLLTEDDLRWTRAVVYSDEPMLGNLNDSDSIKVCAVTKAGKPDCERIRAFFETGVLPSLEPIWQLIGELATFHMCCLTAWRLIRSGIDIRLPVVRTYGVSAYSAVNPEQPFDPALIGWSKSPTPLFNADSISFFSEAAQQEFAKHFDFACKANLYQRKKPGQPGRSLWEDLRRVIHPVESLESLSPIRALWELIQTGGEQSRIEEHPMIEDAQFSARQRCWIVDRLRTIAEISKDIGRVRIIKDAIDEHAWLSDVSQAVAAAQAWERVR